MRKGFGRGEFVDWVSLVKQVETAFLKIEKSRPKDFRRRSAHCFLGASFRNRRPRRRRNSQLVQNVKPPPRRERQNARRNFVRIVSANARPAFNAKRLPAARKEQPQIIVNLRRRRPVRSRIPRSIFLPN